MDTSQIIAAFSTTSTTDLGKDIILIGEELPKLLDDITLQITKGNLLSTLGTIKAAASEIKAMRRVNHFYHRGDDMA